MQTNIDGNFREKVRETFLDLLENERERFYPLFIEIIEDIALSRAMEEGEKALEVDEEKLL